MVKRISKPKASSSKAISATKKRVSKNKDVYTDSVVNDGSDSDNPWEGSDDDSVDDEGSDIGWNSEDELAFGKSLDRKQEIDEEANINGDIKSNNAIISGAVKGDVESEKIHVSKSADVEGSFKQKILSIEEGAKLKIKSETNK